jgi:Zn-dependent metalloprotease
VIPKHHPIPCIVPEHILRALAENKDKRLRDIAFRTLTGSARIRGRREAIGRFPLATPAGAKRRTIYDAQHGTDLPGQLARSEGVPSSSDSAVNEAYDGLGATCDLYSEVFQRDSIDDRGMELVASVHYDQDYDNAFWDGRQMVFGDGDGIIFVGFTKSLDVIGHELTHGVTQFTSNLEYEGQSGALNESFSDVFGSLVKQYHNGEDTASADWLIGEGILAPGINGEALRSMKDPGSAYDDPNLGGKDPQPGDMGGFVPDGDVHINSGIPNHAFYLLADQLGGNAWDNAGHIWYETLLRLWPSAQFQDCANVSHSVAGELFGAGSPQQQAVATAWSEVGIRVARRSRRPKHRPRRDRAEAGHNGHAHLRKQLDRLSSAIRETVGALDE